MRNISFSPPDITEVEIDEVVDTLKSGWITTGPKTKLFEKKLSEYVGTDKTICLNSATAALELALKVLGIGEGDEVIVPAYTYSASASVIDHVGAKIIMIDSQMDNFEMDYSKVQDAINENTKAIIAVDIAGRPCDYDRIFEIVESKKEKFKPKNEIQRAIGRVIVIDDAAHAIGAIYKGKMVGSVADFTAYSFHAVKNLTTAEGGALTWRNIDGIDNDEIYKSLNLWSLHGQTKDALSKMKLGAWEYDIFFTGYKCNMTDIMAALGIAQLSRYSYILKRRKDIVEKYDESLSKIGVKTLAHTDENYVSSGHLYLALVDGIDINKRNTIIEKMAECGIACNVHYKPLPMLTAYKNLGFNIENYPNAYNLFLKEISLPLHTLLTDDEVEYIIDNFIRIVEDIR